jgi:hypothetical protein
MSERILIHDLSLNDVLAGHALKVDESRPVGCLHAIGIFMGVLTFMAGIIGSIQAYFIPLPFVAFISYLLCASGHFYVKHRRLTAIGGVIATIVGVGLVIALFNYPPFEKDLRHPEGFGGGFLAFLVILAGLLAFTDAAVLFLRLWQTRKVEKEEQGKLPKRVARLWVGALVIVVSAVVGVMVPEILVVRDAYPPADLCGGLGLGFLLLAALVGTDIIKVEERTRHSAIVVSLIVGWLFIVGWALFYEGILFIFSPLIWLERPRIMVVIGVLVLILVFLFLLGRRSRESVKV